MTHGHKKFKFEDISNNIIYSELLGIEYNQEYQPLIDILDKLFTHSQTLNKDKTYTYKGKYFYHYSSKRNTLYVDTINIIKPLSQYLYDGGIMEMVKFYVNKKYDMTITYVTSYKFGFYDISKYI